MRIVILVFLWVLSVAADITEVGCGEVFSGTANWPRDASKSAWAAAFSTSRARRFDGSTPLYRLVHRMSYSTAQNGPCVIKWNPKRRGSIVTSVILAFRASVKKETCPIVILLKEGKNQTLVAGESDSEITSELRWENPPLPVHFHLPSPCSIDLAVEASREGKLGWAAWVPLVLWALLAAGITATLVIRRQYKEPLFLVHLPALTTAVGVLFLGFLSSLIALGLSLSLWETTVSSFPFPASTTVFLSVAVGFALLFPPALWTTFAVRSVVASMTLKLLLHSVIISLAVSLWIRQYAILASISTALQILSNIFTFQMYLHLCSLLPSRIVQAKVEENFCTFLMWFPVFIPFAPLATLYSQMMLALEKDDIIDLHQIVQLFDAMLGFRGMLVCSIPQAIVFVLASALHPPFIVLFVLFIVFALWDGTLSTRRCAKAGRRFQISEPFSLGLWPAIEHTLRDLERKHSQGTSFEEVLKTRDAAIASESMQRTTLSHAELIFGDEDGAGRNSMIPPTPSEAASRASHRSPPTAQIIKYDPLHRSSARERATVHAENFLAPSAFASGAAWNLPTEPVPVARFRPHKPEEIEIDS